MAMYLIIAMVGLSLGSLLVPLVVNSSQTTRSDTTRNHAIDAARTGLNVMLGEIRTSSTSDDSGGVVGTSTKLPCSAASGVVNSTATYSVTVAYYMNNPVTVPNATAMRCVDGYGTYDPTSGAFTPRFARITSVGKDSPANATTVSGTTPGRTLTSIYTFKTTNTNIVGGVVRVYPASSTSTSYCWDAGSATPTAGASVTMQVCSQPPTAQQTFAYRSDLTLQLVSSATTALPNGLCLDTADPPAQGNPVVLKNCSALGSPVYTQQWSFNDSGGFTASTSTSKANGALSGYCIAIASQNVGIPLSLAGCDGNTASTTQAWIPNPAVGAGGAASPQLINYEEFGRCLDVTGQNTSAGHLIDYPCKQNPLQSAVAWNQKFTPPATAAGATSGTGQLYTTPSSTKYCLTSPGTNSGYVTTTVCVDGQANQQWTVYNGDASLPYSAKYQIVDSGGRCLGLTDAVSGEQWSAIDVEPCTGAVEQKWNASPDLVSSTVSGITEANSNGG